MSKPGTSTLGWIHFGVIASGVIAGAFGFLPLPFSGGLVVAAVAGEVKNYLTKKQTDQENSMKE